MLFLWVFIIDSAKRFFPRHFQSFSVGSTILGLEPSGSLLAIRATVVDRQELEGFSNPKAFVWSMAAHLPTRLFSDKTMLYGCHMSAKVCGTLCSHHGFLRWLCSCGRFKKAISFAAVFFFDQKFAGFTSTYKVLFPRVLIVFARDSVTRLKSWTCDHPYPLLHSFVFPLCVWFGGHHVFVVFFVCLIPLLISIPAELRSTISFSWGTW